MKKEKLSYKDQMLLGGSNQPDITNVELDSLKFTSASKWTYYSVFYSFQFYLDVVQKMKLIKHL